MNETLPVKIVGDGYRIQRRRRELYLCRMPAFVQTSASPIPSPTLVVRPRLVPSRVIEKAPPKHGEKPFDQLVADAFDGPVLRLSQRMHLLEEARNRKIRRGDAIDLIDSIKEQAQRIHAVRKPSNTARFARHFAAFAAAYAIVAAAACLVVSAHH